MNIVLVRHFTGYKPYVFRVPEYMALSKGDIVKTGENSDSIGVCVSNEESVSDNVADMICILEGIKAIKSEIKGVYRLHDEDTRAFAGMMDIVLCKDCKYFKPNRANCTAECEYFECSVKPDGFCNNGMENE